MTGIRRGDPTIRVLARPPAHLTMPAARKVVATALSRTSWGRDVAFRCRDTGAPAGAAAEHDVLIDVATADAVGAPRYAARAHELVQLLYDSGAFVRVEADIPVPAFDPDNITAPLPPVRRARGAARPAGPDPCDAEPGSAPHDWVLTEMRVPQALALLPAGAAGGKGIRIGHPDSGYSNHPALGLARLDLTTDRDVISGDNDAVDPLRKPNKSIFRPLPNSGHGTSTGSVVVGVGDAAGFTGVAPGAVLVPIRATESVVQVFDTDVAKAVRWARTHGCHIVSMSLGGKGLFGLEDAIQEAVDSGMIVMAAAGNQVGFVTAPASYPNCLAVAATKPGAVPWSDSSRGRQVDLSAPGACVWSAMFDWDHAPPKRIVKRSNGTSYAVAHVAGVAALWLAHHGHAKLAATYGTGNIQNLFLTMVRRPGVCRRSPGWNASQFGAGVIDAEALLRAPLPPPQGIRVHPAAFRSERNDPLERIALHIDQPVEAVGAWIDTVLGPGSHEDVALLRRFEGELVFHLSTPAGRAALASGSRRPSPGARAAPPTSPTVPPGASPQLRKLIRSR